jgi:hypothetical protein
MHDLNRENKLPKMCAIISEMFKIPAQSKLSSIWRKFVQSGYPVVGPFLSPVKNVTFAGSRIKTKNEQNLFRKISFQAANSRSIYLHTYEKLNRKMKWAALARRRGAEASQPPREQKT